MPLLGVQERWAERFMPGVIAAIKAVASGDFVEEKPELTPGHGGVRTVLIHLTYRTADHAYISVARTFSHKRECPPYDPDETDRTPVTTSHWDVIHYALHYGPGPRGNGVDDCTFRFDLDQTGHHVHMLPKPSIHNKAATVQPDIREPFAFLDFVAKYRANPKPYPVKKRR